LLRSLIVVLRGRVADVVSYNAAANAITPRWNFSPQSATIIAKGVRTAEHLS